jgi:hypothetical protein
VTFETEQRVCVKFGAAVADDMGMRPVTRPRITAAALDDDLGADDGTLIPLIQPGTAADLIREHGTAAAAARALTVELRTAGVL